MKVKCVNCGMIWEYCGWLGDCYAYPRDYKLVTDCPRCKSNAFDVLAQPKPKRRTKKNWVA